MRAQGFRTFLLRRCARARASTFLQLRELWGVLPLQMGEQPLKAGRRCIGLPLMWRAAVVLRVTASSSKTGGYAQSLIWRGCAKQAKPRLGECCFLPHKMGKMVGNMSTRLMP